MEVRKAVVTAAAPQQRTLPLQRLVDCDGVTKSVLSIVVEEAVRAGIEEVCIVIHAGDEAAYREAASDSRAQLRFVPQTEAKGYGHALWCAREFVGDAPFLHMVGDHIYVRTQAAGLAERLVQVARQNESSVSGVQPTRENLLPYFGAIGGLRVAGTSDLYQVERVIEKPTPTEAEQTLVVPGLRMGYYLCFVGMHVLTPAVMELLSEQVATAASGKVGLSPVLDKLAQQERYLAVEAHGRRFPVDVKYGLLFAQLALALSGDERDEVLTGLSDLLADQELRRVAAPRQEA